MSKLKTSPYYPGERDKSFGNDGLVLLHELACFPPSRILGLTGTPDDKFYATGFACAKAPLPRPYLLARFNADGTYDKAFGENGMITGYFGESTRSGEGESVILLTDGKILMTGKAGGLVALARFHADGTPDLAFGNKGSVIIDLPTTANISRPSFAGLTTQSDNTVSTMPLPDGKLVLALVGGNYILRLHSNGDLDTDFGDKGYVTVKHPDSAYATYMLNMLTKPNASDRPLACGMVIHRATNKVLGFIARYLSDGQLDRSFGTNGFVMVQATPDTMIDKLQEQHDGRIVGIGQAATAPESGMLVRFDVFGNRDMTFNNGEPVFANLDDTLATIWVGSALDDLENIVVGGAVSLHGVTAEIVVARFLSDGLLDKEFNLGAGFVRTKLVDGISAPTTMTQHKNRIIVAGYMDRTLPFLLCYRS
ncbi:hypothetical protein ACQKP7_17425 [Pseudomonas frederiksbergensis]|uniref:hypothetical protein n=1 Tax=Pseudomonas frederiksbergensis TaxID=104087 RepID=UPI003D04CF3D